MGLGLTLVDALDTLLLMNLTTEYEEARAWIAAEFDPDQVGIVVEKLDGGSGDIHESALCTHSTGCCGYRSLAISATDHVSCSSPQR